MLTAFQRKICDARGAVTTASASATRTAIIIGIAVFGRGLGRSWYMSHCDLSVVVLLLWRKGLHTLPVEPTCQHQSTNWLLLVTLHSESSNSRTIEFFIAAGCLIFWLVGVLWTVPLISCIISS